MNRIVLDFGLKLETVNPESFINQHLTKLATSKKIKERVVLREVNKDIYWELIEKVARTYLSYLDMSYRGGSPSSILSAYAFYLSDTVLN